MNRRRLILAVAVLSFGIPSLLLAETNAVIGSWKLNLEKSKFPVGMAYKSLTRTVTADGDKITYSFEGEGTDGAVKYGFTAKYDGKDYGVTGNGMAYGADHIAIKRVSAHKYMATLKKDGKVVATSTAIVSADGKTTTLESKSTDAKGNGSDSTSVYDKQ